MEIPEDPVFRKFRTRLSRLDLECTYPAWWTDQARTRFLEFSDEHGIPISFTELLTRPALCDCVAACRAARQREVGSKRPELSLLVERDTTSGVCVVKDGNKELLARLRSGDDGPLWVVEVSGHDWSRSVFDMRRMLAFHHRNLA